MSQAWLQDTLEFLRSDWAYHPRYLQAFNGRGEFYPTGKSNAIAELVVTIASEVGFEKPYRISLSVAMAIAIRFHNESRWVLFECYHEDGDLCMLLTDRSTGELDVEHMGGDDLDSVEAAVAKAFAWSRTIPSEKATP